MIEQVCQAQLAACLDVIRTSFQTVADEFGLTPENCPTNGAFMPLGRLQSDFNRGGLMFALKEDGQIVGFMQLWRKDADTFELEKLAVLPPYRHNGHGKALISFAKARAIELGADKITIGIIEENTRLKKWYKAHGFVGTGTRDFPHLPFTVGFMECALRHSLAGGIEMHLGSIYIN